MVRCWPLCLSLLVLSTFHTPSLLLRFERVKAGTPSPLPGVEVVDVVGPSRAQLLGVLPHLQRGGCCSARSTGLKGTKMFVVNLRTRERALEHARLEQGAGCKLGLSGGLVVVRGSLLLCCLVLRWPRWKTSSLVPSFIHGSPDCAASPTTHVYDPLTHNKRQ